jgi:hypothetical protein
MRYTMHSNPTRNSSRHRPAVSRAFVYLLTFTVMFQQIAGMIVSTKMLMRPALAMSCCSTRTCFLLSRQHVDIEKSLYSYGKPQMYPRYFAGQTDFRLLTASDSIISEDVSSNKGIDDNDQIVDDEESVDSMNLSHNNDKEDETNRINHFPRG